MYILSLCLVWCPGWDYLSFFPICTFLASVPCTCISMYNYTCITSIAGNGPEFAPGLVSFVHQGFDAGKRCDGQFGKTLDIGTQHGVLSVGRREGGREGGGEG